jgi:hypothetical protein
MGFIKKENFEYFANAAVFLNWEVCPSLAAGYLAAMQPNGPAI